MQPITIRSRKLRKNQTPAEELIWQEIRNRKMGVKIVRQKPIMLTYFGKTKAFIADFYCSQAKLIIEIDGNVHTRQSDYDSLRTMLLNQKGLRLIRFTNSEVTNDMKTVLLRIIKEVASPLPLSTSGEG